MQLKKIAIHSVPRSGSSWLGCIFDSAPQSVYRFQPLFSYGHKGQLTENASKKDINDFFEDIRYTKDPLALHGITNSRTPVFKKEKSTHIVYKEVRYHYILENLLKKDVDIKIIGLVRSPFATIHSWLNAPREFKKELGWKVEEEWIYAPSKNQNRSEEFNGFEKWKEVTHLFLKLQQEYPDQFYLLNYDKLLQHTKAEIKKAFDFCGLTFTKQTELFIEQSTSSTFEDDDAYSVYNSKTKDDAWQDGFPDFITQAIKNDPEFIRLNHKFKWIDNSL